LDVRVRSAGAGAATALSAFEYTPEGALGTAYPHSVVVGSHRRVAITGPDLGHGDDYQVLLAGVPAKVLAASPTRIVVQPGDVVQAEALDPAEGLEGTVSLSVSRHGVTAGVDSRIGFRYSPKCEVDGARLTPGPGDGLLRLTVTGRHLGVGDERVRVNGVAVDPGTVERRVGGAHGDVRRLRGLVRTASLRQGSSLEEVEVDSERSGSCRFTPDDKRVNTAQDDDDDAGTEPMGGEFLVPPQPHEEAKAPLRAKHLKKNKMTTNKVAVKKTKKIAVRPRKKKAVSDAVAVPSVQDLEDDTATQDAQEVKEAREVKEAQEGSREHIQEMVDDLEDGEGAADVDAMLDDTAFVQQADFDESSHIKERYCHEFKPWTKCHPKDWEGEFMNYFHTKPLDLAQNTSCKHSFKFVQYRDDYKLHISGSHDGKDCKHSWGKKFDKKSTMDPIITLKANCTAHVSLASLDVNVEHNLARKGYVYDGALDFILKLGCVDGKQKRCKYPLIKWSGMYDGEGGMWEVDGKLTREPKTSCGTFWTPTSK
jgi:hypothetical protein